jgi:hypothetical protein
MFDPSPAQESPFSLVILLSGAAGAVVAAVITLWSTVYLDRKNKAWTLRAELRRYKVNRLISASDGLRSCFFKSITLMGYHSLELRDIETKHKQQREETEAKRKFTSNDLIQPRLEEIDSVRDGRIQQAIIRYNAALCEVEASAQSFVASLDDDLIPEELHKRMASVLDELTASNTTDSKSVDARVAFHKAAYPAIKKLLREVDATISKEIQKPIRA